MTLDNSTFLTSLLSCSSVAGAENEALACYDDFMHENGIDTFRDALGNSYAVLNPNASLRVMVEAHIDEIGFQVTYIDDSGFVYVRQNGGVDRVCVPGSKVCIHTADNGRISGVIGKTPIHILRPDDRGKVPELEDLWIDTGLSMETVRSLVSVGDFVSFAPNVMFLGDSGITSKGLDDKAGVYVVAETLRCLKDNPLDIAVYGVASVQEELGCKGAKICIANARPDISISIDVGFATDVPGLLKKKYGDIALGKGPIINHHADCDRDLVRFAADVAAENGISVQHCANHISTGGTNAASLQVSGSGVRTMLLGIPNRYMHTQVEMCDVRDLQESVRLLVALISKIDKDRRYEEGLHRD